MNKSQEVKTEPSEIKKNSPDKPEPLPLAEKKPDTDEERTEKKLTSNDSVETNSSSSTQNNVTVSGQQSPVLAEEEDSSVSSTTGPSQSLPLEPQAHDLMEQPIVTSPVTPLAEPINSITSANFNGICFMSYRC